jgi:hypothetical protein
LTYPISCLDCGTTAKTTLFNGSCHWCGSFNLTKGVEEMLSQIKPVEPETTRSARMIEVIETISIRGDGFDSPVREVIQYWSKEGILLAEQDPCK